MFYISDDPDNFRITSKKRNRSGLGTDDGYVQLTLDDGKTWTNVTKNIPGLPEYTWVSHICASRYAEGRAYATFDGHRNFDLKTYVYVTEDYGKTWTKLDGNLPGNESCYVITEGLKNPDLLFLGTGVLLTDFLRPWQTLGPLPELETRSKLELSGKFSIGKWHGRLFANSCYS